MAKPHKHAEVIKAWADGKPVQFRVSANAGWEDLNTTNVVGWYEDYQYRIKPRKFVDITFSGMLGPIRFYEGDHIKKHEGYINGRIDKIGEE